MPDEIANFEDKHSCHKRLCCGTTDKRLPKANDVPFVETNEDAPKLHGSFEGSTNDVPKLLCNFEELGKYLKNSNLPFRDAILEYYASLGEKLGFTVRRNSLVVQHGINMGRLDLMWVEPAVVFICEFGEFENLLKQAWKAVEVSPGKIVVITSSKAKCSTKNVCMLVERSEVIGKIRPNFVIIDVNDRISIFFQQEKNDIPNL